MKGSPRAGLGPFYQIPGLCSDTCIGCEVLDDCCVQLLIIMDCECNHSMGGGSPMDGTPHSPKTNSDHLIKDNRGRYCQSIMINKCTQQSANTSQQSLKSRAIKGKERGVAVGGSWVS